MRRLLKSSAFRLALAYTALFALFGLGLIGFIYWTTIRVIDAQADATIDAEILGLVEQYRTSGLPGLVRTVRDRTAGMEGEGSLYLLEGPDGATLAGNLRGWPHALPDTRGWIEFTIRPIGAAALPPTRARARAFELAGDYHLLVGRDLTGRRVFQHIILFSLAGALGVLVLLGAAGGLITSRSLLRRLDAINRTSGEILAGSLDRRVPVWGRGDEFDRLAANLNAMLDQIERLMTGMRQVADNLAHDLRSPLTRLRSRLEQMQREASGPESAAPGAAGQQVLALEGAVAEVDHLLATFQALLSIAQAEAGSARRHFAALDLGTLVRDVVDLYRPAAEEKGLRLEERIEAPPALAGDRHLLAQALANLVDNAIKYTPRGGLVVVAAGSGPRAKTAGVEVGPVPGGRHLRASPQPLAWLEVADDGPGVPAAERGHVLERFVRLEASRNLPGSGLGLSLVAAVATLHHARLVLEENGPGLRIALEFPGPPAG